MKEPRNYYNDNDPHAARALRNLIAAGVLPPGDVDDRSIKEVKCHELAGYTQCHFFAGWGGWPLALALAGIPRSRSLWTGSCPCQPYSAAGEGAGQSDERHLWPDWYRLIRERGPAEILGEQVARAIAFGWACEVGLDLEAETYAFASAVLPACGAEGAYHQRDRYFFVADRSHHRLQGRADAAEAGKPMPESAGLALEHTNHAGLEGYAGDAEDAARWKQIALRYIAEAGSVELIGCPDGKTRAAHPGIRIVDHGVSNRMAAFGLIGDAVDPRITAKFIEAALL